ncbi:hypothetical protein KAU34_07550 [candidate division WOR-3 bacterium]|nr:hypothetical protein [candidate division WOR-3 bacterium]
MDLIKVGADTQVSIKGCFIKMLVIDHSAATTVALYNEGDATHTAAKMRFSMRSTANELTKMVIFPGRGLRFPDACALDWAAGVVYYGLG